MMMAKVKVYRKDTGEIVRVPEHWIGHPTLGEPFRKTPSQKTRDLAKQEAAEREAAEAALAAIHQTPDSRADETANTPSNPDESATAGDDK
jgi:hypothetical protein